jgi:hypothetical protein
MKLLQPRFLLFFVFILIFTAACQAEREPSAALNGAGGGVSEGAHPPAAETESLAAPAGAEGNAVDDVSASSAEGDQAETPADAEGGAGEGDERPSPVAEPSAETPEISENLPLLPILQTENTNGIGEPLSASLFSDVPFNLNVSLPNGPATAVVQQHDFGQIDESAARNLADQLGFTGPLYVQQIAAGFGPAEGEEVPTIYTAFDGRRILNIGGTGLTYEDRGVFVDFSQQPVFSEIAPLVEAQLSAWGLLDFPYELRELPLGDLAIFRLIDGVAVEQNEFNILVNQAGEIAFLDYRPLREVSIIGRYPLQTAEMAWQQLQNPGLRDQFRFQMLQPNQGDGGVEGFVNPRSWVPSFELGEEAHLYISPAVFEATDGSGLHIIWGEFTIIGDSEELAEIATHLTDVLHIWGTVDEANGAKTLAVSGWEKVAVIRYETFEGTIVREAGQTLLETLEGDTFILAGVPEEMPDGIEAYVSTAARRDIGAAYPLVDWLSITEKIDWPDLPPVMADEEPAAFEAVVIDSADLIYFTLHQSIDGSETNLNMLFVPVWKFSGMTDQGQIVTFWIPAVAIP